MAPRKRASWVGRQNPLDPNTNLQKPLAEMGGEALGDTLSGSASAKAVKPRRKGAGGATGPRPELGAVTRGVLNAAQIREPKRGELARGITAVSTAPKKARKKAEPKGPSRPKKGQIRKVDDKLVRVDESNIEAATKEALTTKLPTAGPDVMLPKTGARVPLEMPKGGLKPELISKKPFQVEQRLRGFASPVKVAAPKIWEAMGHIDAMQNHQKGTKQHTFHATSFSKLVPHVVKHTHGGVADILAGVDRIAFADDYPDKQKHLNMAKDALTETISVARMMEKRKAAARAEGNK